MARRYPAGIVSSIVRRDVPFEDRGLHELRGVPGPWPLFALS